MSDVTTQYCLECERLALISAMKAVHAQKVKEGDKVRAADLWNDIQYHQRHQHVHTCGGKR